MTSTQATLDEGQVEEFMGQLMSIYTGSLLNYMLDLGHRTGLLKAVAGDPGTSDELAGRAGLEERYVREWLAAMVSGGIVDYDPPARTYWLRPERAACLTEGPMNLAPIAAFNTHLGKHVHQVARAFREGGGVPYSAYRPEFTDVMDGISRTVLDGFLLDAYVPLVPGLAGRLTAGAQVTDVACGTGHALVLLAQAYPASTFVGYDLDDAAIAQARAEARGAGLTNVTFETADAARLGVENRFDAAFVFDAIHDQVDPAAVLANINRALVAGGTFLMKEPHGADDLEGNLANPMAAALYSSSTLHCMTVSLAHGGAGIGTVFGEGLALRMLAEAGFVDVRVHPAPGDPPCAVYVSRKEGQS